jgi:hypothetical protein
MVSTESQLKDSTAARLAGANGYIVKPARPADLVLTAALLLGDAAAAERAAAGRRRRETAHEDLRTAGPVHQRVARRAGTHRPPPAGGGTRARQPRVLNDLFRQVHTLKGNCGLFEFKALERVVHAGEDLLDRVRNGTCPTAARWPTPCSKPWTTPPNWWMPLPRPGNCRPAPTNARRRWPRLCANTCPAPPWRPARRRAAATAAPPAWALDLPAQWQRSGHHAVRYRPEPECFFKGEDPWHLARSTPGLRHLAVAALDPWPAAEVFDCYRCNLDLLLVSDAPVAALHEHFRYVPEQVELCELTTPPAQPAANPRRCACCASARPNCGTCSGRCWPARA